ncbi:MAG: ribosomal protein methyltransferase [Verrucomicrobia bacterium]|nr:ribosomal protein methyltransferase [Verrucomicrobiota bacterium]
MDLVEIKAEIPPGEVESADLALQESGVAGWTLLEDAVARRAWIVGIFSSRTEAAERWTGLREMFLADLAAVPEMRELPEAEWRDSYKAHFKAWRFGRLHWVPVWERESHVLPAGEEVLWLDPGLAFGTGNHETTRLCVERLVNLEEQMRARGEDPARVSVIDAGCGSGILALSAAKLGFGKIRGFDNDPEAVRVSQENAELNGQAGRVEFGIGDLVTGLRGSAADVVVANILADVLIQFAPELARAVAPDGELILSGILATENEKVRAAYRAVVPGWHIEFRLLGEWSDVRLRRPSR